MQVYHLEAAYNNSLGQLFETKTNNMSPLVVNRTKNQKNIQKKKKKKSTYDKKGSVSDPINVVLFNIQHIISFSVTKLCEMLNPLI